MFKRKVQLGVQPLLTEFRAASADLTLILPTRPSTLNRQIEQILKARQKLIALQRQLQRHLIKEIPASLQQQLHLLLHSTSDLLQIASSLVMLAEEYPLDPEGSLACLRSISRRKATILKQVQEMVGLPSAIA